MATMRTSGDILTRIATNLADNNAGLISAADVRDNMEDTVFSINRIVASGDTDGEFPFFNDVRAKHDVSEGTGGTFIVESGVLFPNAPLPSMRTIKQLEPFRGEGNITHNNLAGLTAGDPHPQYLNVAGVGASNNNMTGNFELGNNWIGASGNNHMGFKFAPNSAGTEDILTSGDLLFGDNSRINTGFSVAKAWLSFQASGVGTIVPVVNSFYNVSDVTKNNVGKFTITFNSGVFSNNNYVAIGTSNGTTTSGSKEDMDVNTVACVIREGNDDNDGLRTCTFVIQNDAGNYVDGRINDFVAYGYDPNGTPGTAPTIVGYGG